MTSPSLVELSDRSGIKYYVHQVGERTYPVYETWDGKDYAELLDLVKTMEIRSDDVLLTGYPKCGNNWAHEVISMIKDQTSDYVPKIMIEDLLDYKSPEMFEELNQTPSPRFMVTHLNPDSIPTQIAKKGAKLIYLTRNVKDMVVSGYNFVNILTTFFPYKGTWEDFLEITLFGDAMVYGSWFEHVKQADLYIKQHPDVPIYVLCYETLKNDTVREIQRLCSFLGYPDTLAEQIADRVNFKKMKPAMLEGKLKEFTEAVCEPGTHGVFRKVQHSYTKRHLTERYQLYDPLSYRGRFFVSEIGDWKNMFTVAQSERVNTLFDELLADSPIGQMVKPYM